MGRGMTAANRSYAIDPANGFPAIVIRYYGGWLRAQVEHGGVTTSGGPAGDVDAAVLSLQRYIEEGGADFYNRHRKG
jgi:hypothetical protein